MQSNGSSAACPSMLGEVVDNAGTGNMRGMKLGVSECGSVLTPSANNTCIKSWPLHKHTNKMCSLIKTLINVATDTRKRHGGSTASKDSNGRG